MNKKILLIMGLCLVIFCQAFAQNHTVTGTVTGKDDGLAVPGVTVKIKGTQVGTQTNSAGKYTISAPNGSVLEFSFIGYLPVQLTVQGDVLNVTLTPASSQLNEVVVTSQGIKREKRTLGYSAPTVSNKELTEGGNPSALTSLTGLVAGVNITSTSNTPGSSTRIVLRGGSSITGNNQALMVVDGVPIDNSSIISGASSLTAVDFGNRGNDIDPNDIASITVLKGPAAAALYGSRASNGALMITTKSGTKNGKKLEITLNSTNTFSSVLKLPTFQNEYGQGYMSGSATSPGYVTGINDASDNFSWGAPFTGKVEPWGQEIDGVTQTKPYSALPNNIKDFFKTGFAADNNVGIASGDDKNSFYLGLNSLNSSGIFPTNDSYDKYGVRFNGKATLANNFTASVNFNYNKIQANTPSGGQGSNGIWTNLMQTPRDIPINTMGNLNNKYNGYNSITNTYGFYGAFTTNPYYILQNYSNLDDVNRVTGDVNLAWKPLSWLNIVERVGADSYSDRRKLIQPKYTFLPADESGSGLWGKITNKGSYEVDQYNVNEVVHDLMVTATHDFGKDFHTSLLLGNNIRERSTTSNLTSTNTSGGLVVPGWYNLDNSNGPVNVITDDIEIKRLIGFYADLNLSYKDYLFLEGTLRNDRSSTLPLNNYSYFYPSVSGSFVFSELLKNSGIADILSYGKIRSSFAQVGSDTDPHELTTTYGRTTVNGSFGNTTFPFGNVPAYQIGSTLGNAALKPEQTSSFEIGTELAFLQSRLSFDFSYYVNNSKNQIIPIPVPGSTGYGFNEVNAGEIQNKGIELTINGTPIQTSDLTWNIFGTFTKNNSDVLALPNGAGQIVIGGFSGMAIVAAKGHPYGEFYGVTNQTDAQGRTIVSKTTGQPIATTTAQYLGSYEPKFQTSLGTNVKYKNFTVSVLFDVKHGGVLYSQTKSLTDFVGTSAETGGPRFGQPFPNSVTLDASGKSVPNTSIPYSVYNYYTNVIGNTPGMNVVDASYIKMRSASISYTFDKTQLKSLPFGALTVGVFGNNLFLWTPKSNAYVDPEVNSSGAGNEQGFDFSANPSVRNYGINLKVSF
ncbi:TonB-linked outer membrane protein, SusC/RagA family [Mucilaginibacter mallensis]|uniref:TonB-linked outer membrane protein, SusC/RagA family n=1 Tax=Mucilaginibacter mallensis TaxID=652787 RepID=A0A1H1ZNS7_MUCMA|nr:SusC/RagA family TonB-linked outer membrane protein [Mucilaginibacter mallensis]SDT34876.1 TonB-linked outer membrane protein, SusC/RagA family [Mucilaginibacter mallensis]